MPLLVEAIKEQQKQINALQAVVQGCCDSMTIKIGEGGGKKEQWNNATTELPTITVELTSLNNIILYQNIPNPFSGTIIIRYFVPETVKSDVKMIFSDEFGRTLKIVEITERGFGEIEVLPKDLASGIYTYSILAADKVIDTKKMIYQK